MMLSARAKITFGRLKQMYADVLYTLNLENYTQPQDLLDYPDNFIITDWYIEVSFFASKPISLIVFLTTDPVGRMMCVNQNLVNGIPNETWLAEIDLGEGNKLVPMQALFEDQLSFKETFLRSERLQSLFPPQWINLECNNRRPYLLEFLLDKTAFACLIARSDWIDAISQATLNALFVYESKMVSLVKFFLNSPEKITATKAFPELVEKFNDNSINAIEQLDDRNSFAPIPLYLLGSDEGLDFIDTYPDVLDKMKPKVFLPAHSLKYVWKNLIGTRHGRECVVRHKLNDKFNLYYAYQFKQVLVYVEENAHLSEQALNFNLVKQFCDQTVITLGKLRTLISKYQTTRDENLLLDHEIDHEIIINWNMSVLTSRNDCMFLVDFLLSIPSGVRMLENHPPIFHAILPYLFLPPNSSSVAIFLLLSNIDSFKRLYLNNQYFRDILPFAAVIRLMKGNEPFLLDIFYNFCYLDFLADHQDLVAQIDEEILNSKVFSSTMLAQLCARDYGPQFLLCCPGLAAKITTKGLQSYHPDVSGAGELLVSTFIGRLVVRTYPGIYRQLDKACKKKFHLLSKDDEKYNTKLGYKNLISTLRAGNVRKVVEQQLYKFRHLNLRDLFNIRIKEDDGKYTYFALYFLRNIYEKYSWLNCITPNIWQALDEKNQMNGFRLLMRFWPEALTENPNLYDILTPQLVSNPSGHLTQASTLAILCRNEAIVANLATRTDLLNGIEAAALNRAGYYLTGYISAASGLLLHDAGLKLLTDCEGLRNKITPKGLGVLNLPIKPPYHVKNGLIPDFKHLLSTQSGREFINQTNFFAMIDVFYSLIYLQVIAHVNKFEAKLTEKQLQKSICDLIDVRLSQGNDVPLRFMLKERTWKLANTIASPKPKPVVVAKVSPSINKVEKNEPALSKIEVLYNALAETFKERGISYIVSNVINGVGREDEGKIKKQITLIADKETINHCVTAVKTYLKFQDQECSEITATENKQFKFSFIKTVNILTDLCNNQKFKKLLAGENVIAKQEDTHNYDEAESVYLSSERQQLWTDALKPAFCHAINPSLAKFDTVTNKNKTYTEITIKLKAGDILKKIHRPVKKLKKPTPLEKPIPNELYCTLTAAAILELFKRIHRYFVNYPKEGACRYSDHELVIIPKTTNPLSLTKVYHEIFDTFYQTCSETDPDSMAAVKTADLENKDLNANDPASDELPTENVEENLAVVNEPALTPTQEIENIFKTIIANHHSGELAFLRNMKQENTNKWTITYNRLGMKSFGANKLTLCQIIELIRQAINTRIALIRKEAGLLALTDRQEFMGKHVNGKIATIYINCKWVNLEMVKNNLNAIKEDFELLFQHENEKLINDLPEVSAQLSPARVPAVPLKPRPTPKKVISEAAATEGLIRDALKKIYYDQDKINCICDYLDILSRIPAPEVSERSLNILYVNAFEFFNMRLCETLSPIKNDNLLQKLRDHIRHSRDLGWKHFYWSMQPFLNALKKYINIETRTAVKSPTLFAYMPSEYNDPRANAAAELMKLITSYENLPRKLMAESVYDEKLNRIHAISSNNEFKLPALLNVNAEKGELKKNKGTRHRELFCAIGHRDLRQPYVDFENDMRRDFADILQLPAKVAQETLSA